MSHSVAIDPAASNDAARDALEARITELWGHLNAATYRFLVLVAEFDRSEGWARHGLANSAQWLNWQCGIGTVAAREKVRVARALEQLPTISDSFRLGRISYSKVRAMTRVATPANEAVLLNVALHGTAVHVERLVRKFRRVERLEEAHQAERRHTERRLNWHFGDDGCLVLHGRLRAEVGALLVEAIDAAAGDLDGASAESIESLHKPSTSADTSGPVGAEHDSAEARRADGLVHLAQIFLDTATRRDSSAADRYQVVVHISESALRCGHDGDVCSETFTEVASDCSEIEDGPRLARETARRLACGGSLVGIVENSRGEPLDIGRKSRAIPSALKRALKARDGGCRFPGCDRSLFTEGHHVRHWANGGATKLGNLVTLCRHHHRLLHEGGFGLRVTADGAFVFRRPDGSRIGNSGNTAARPREVRGQERFRGNIEAENAGLGLMIDAEVCRSGWRGEPMDYGLAVEAMLR